MKTDTSNKQDDTQNASAVRDCPDSAGSPIECPVLTKHTGAPETEVVWLESGKMEVGDAECHLRKFAEKMERERNEARKLAEDGRLSRIPSNRIFSWENKPINQQ